MKTQIATNIEQSKRLIAAGLDAGSADMQWNAMPNIDGKPTCELFVGDLTPNGMPAWSLSRLIDINGGYNAGLVYDSKCFIEALVQSICFLIPCGDIDEKFLKK